MIRRDSLTEDIGVYLTHVRTIAADSTNIASLLAPFRAGEVFSWEERGSARRAEKDGVGLADVLFQQTLVFAVVRADNAKGELRIRVAQRLPLGKSVKFVHEGLGAGEGAVDDVDVVNFGTTEEESEANMPRCLLSCAEDGDGVDVGALAEDHG